MHSNAILHEAQQLHNVSDRLDTLAEQHPLVSEALITVAGNVRITATVLEVLVATKIAPLAGLDPAGYNLTWFRRDSIRRAEEIMEEIDRRHRCGHAPAGQSA